MKKEPKKKPDKCRGCPWRAATDYTFTAYFSNVGDELLRKKAEKNYWKNLTANFIAQKPART